MLRFPLVRAEANQFRMDHCVWHHKVESVCQSSACFVQRFQWHRRQAFKNEPHPFCIGIQPGSGALTPVPSPACDIVIVTPNDFSCIDRLVDGHTVLHGVEVLRSVGNHKPRHSNVGGKVFAADGNGVFNADRVVQVDYRVDAWNAAVAHRSFSQGISRTGRPLRLGSEPPEHLRPG